MPKSKIQLGTSVNIKGNNLIWAGPGYQPNADIPSGEMIQVVWGYSDRFVEVVWEGNKYFMPEIYLAKEI
jgi:hypothetical protein